MNKSILLIVTLFLGSSSVSTANKDERILVKLPPPMQQHMLSNMRDHLAAISDILMNLATEEFDKAADIAENRLGMSSLSSHGAQHMSKFMPIGMQSIGTSMHRAASRFALRAEEGELLAAYASLTEVTKQCVACHSAYRIK